MGTVSSPGLLFDRSTVLDSNKGTKAIVVYNNTSRTGELMNMKVAIPRIRKSHHKSLSRIISNITELPMDCTQIIVEHLDLFWTETLEQPTDSTHCHRIIQTHSQNNDSKVQVLRNKLPTWNSQLSSCSESNKIRWNKPNEFMMKFNDSLTPSASMHIHWSLEVAPSFRQCTTSN